MMWTAQTRSQMRAACRATLLARLSHPTKIELVRATFVIELRDGILFELTEEVWT